MVCRDKYFVRVVRSERVRITYSFERCLRVRVCVGSRRFSFVARETEERERFARNANVEQLRVGRTNSSGADFD